MIRTFAIVVVSVIFASLFMETGLAQITVTRAVLEKGFQNKQRTQYNHNYSSMPMKNLGNSSGSIQNFDFSAAPAGDIRDTAIQNMVDPWTLPGFANYPSATIGFRTDEEPFPGATYTVAHFWSIEGDGLYSLGYYSRQVFPPFIDTVMYVYHTPKQLILPLPLTYGTSRSYSDSLIIDAANGMYQVHHRTFNCDAFGTIAFPPVSAVPELSKTAAGTNALRVVIDEVIEEYVGGSFVNRERDREILFIADNSTSSSFMSFSVLDTNFTSGSTQVDEMEINIKSEPTSVQQVLPGIPENFSLLQNYPNPFNPKTTIEFGIPEAEFVTLKVFDVLGRDVHSLVNEQLPAGSYRYDFDASHLPSGLYFYRMTAGEYSRVYKMSLIK